MAITWTLGVLPAGVENLHTLAAGSAASREGAVEAASDALVWAAMDRGRQHYRISVADTHYIVSPGLTEHGEVDLFDLAGTLWRMESFRPSEH